MDFKTNQQVLAELSRRLKEVKAHWKDELNPYLQLIVKGNELSVRYFLSDEKTFGCFRFQLEEVIEPGECLIALEDWIGFNVRWKRSGLVRLSVAYPELVVETLDGIHLRIPTHSFYFPELPNQVSFNGELSVREWKQLVLNQSRSLSNQHPLKEYEYVWLFEEKGKAIFQSANETEWSCSRLSLTTTTTSRVIHSFSKTEWLGIKQLVDKGKFREDELVKLGWNERFVIIRFPQEDLLIERSIRSACFILNQTNWFPLFDWRSINSKMELEKIEKVALDEAFRLGGKLPKTFFVYLNHQSNYSSDQGWQLPYRSVVQCLKDYPNEMIELGISQTPEKFPMLAFRKVSTEVEWLRFFVSNLRE